MHARAAFMYARTHPCMPERIHVCRNATPPRRYKRTKDTAGASLGLEGKGLEGKRITLNPMCTCMAYAHSLNTVAGMTCGKEQYVQEECGITVRDDRRDRVPLRSDGPLLSGASAVGAAKPATLPLLPHKSRTLACATRTDSTAERPRGGCPPSVVSGDAPFQIERHGARPAPAALRQLC
eukprot:364318-Chlamydomonas_euryale.AAC.3